MRSSPTCSECRHAWSTVRVPTHRRSRSPCPAKPKHGADDCRPQHLLGARRAHITRRSRCRGRRRRTVQPLPFSLHARGHVSSALSSHGRGRSVVANWRRGWAACCSEHAHCKREAALEGSALAAGIGRDRSSCGLCTLGATLLAVSSAGSVAGHRPVGRHDLLDGADPHLDSYPGLADWWTRAEEVWDEQQGREPT